MIKWAIIFAIISVIAAIFGLTGIAAGSAAIAKFLFGAGSVRTTRACMPDEVKMTIIRSWLIDGPSPVVLSEFARTVVCDRFAPRYAAIGYGRLSAKSIGYGPDT